MLSSFITLGKQIYFPFQDGFHIEFQELLNSDLPQLSNVDVELCDEHSLVRIHCF